jgi:16S rRNA (guanine527-N7)-methyltransferase
MLFLKTVPPGAIRVVDIGAGAGIPGAPMAIARPELSMTLIESRRKRVSFLLSLRRDLKTEDMVVLEGRAEDLVQAHQDLAGGFDVVVTRAAGPIKRILPIAMSYLASGGLFVAGGPSVPEGMEMPGLRSEVVEIEELNLRRTLLLASRTA